MAKVLPQSQIDLNISLALYMPKNIAVSVFIENIQNHTDNSKFSLGHMALTDSSFRGVVF